MSTIDLEAKNRRRGWCQPGEHRWRGDGHDMPACLDCRASTDDDFREDAEWLRTHTTQTEQE